MQLELTVEEINAILQTLGELPTRTGAWPLLMKIKQQAEAPHVVAPAPEE